MREPLRDLAVLVVDDHQDARELVTMILERAGARVTQADSVKTALGAAAAAEFRVLVSDIAMPEADGYELIRRLRLGDGSAQARTIPAVAVTAFAATEDRRKALAAGFQEHLAKPLDAVRLIETVARLAHAGSDRF